MRYWLLANGDSDQSKEFFGGGVVRITGRNRLGNLSRYTLQADVAQALRGKYREEFKTKSPANKARFCFNFSNQITRHKMSIRPMPRKIDPPSYDGDDQVRMVQKGCWFSFKGRLFNCSKAFAGRPLAL